MAEKDNANNVILSAVCPDKQCRSKLFFPSFDTSIQCTHCGQRHDRNTLLNVQEISDLDAKLNDMLRNILMSNIAPKRGTETVKVLGLSNYHCKLLSPLLTNYGMDKRSGKARLLTEMNQGDIFDCGLFGDRAFLIDQEHINVPGFGRDITGSMYYLSKTLDVINSYNNGEERLIPVHADGDGHCLVHAVSRALVGRELFWHPLRCSLKKHFEDCVETYKKLFQDFVDECEWSHIIAECDPDFVPPDGELLGLRNIHVFGLANVLKRPIILLDSLECMQSLGDYAALFLPSLVKPDLCRGKDGQLNKPLCIAWSNPGHNHYIPLVGIKKKPLPNLPRNMLPKVWGVPQNQVTSYIEFEDDGSITIGGNRSLGDPYIKRLVEAMEQLFYEKYGIHPYLVADVHHYLYQSTGVVGTDRAMVIQKTKKAVEEGRLYTCLHCDAVCEQVIKQQWFQPGGVLYNMALYQYERFEPRNIYPFPLHGIVCRYNAEKNELEPDLKLSCLETCTWCNGGLLRRVRSDGTIIYKNEDRTKTPSTASSLCDCGFKHFYNGKEYNNPPKKLNVVLEWNNVIIRDIVCWFENENDLKLNSNVFQVASDIVQKHFPGEFGSERLIHRIVQQILNQTKRPEFSSSESNSDDAIDIQENKENNVEPNKMIVSGKGVLHKEDLGVSNTEQKLLIRVQSNASSQQKRQTEDDSDKSNQLAAKESKLENSVKPEKCNSDKHLPVQFLNPPKQKFVKVATSDGRQANLDITNEKITYVYLQSWIAKNFNIPPECQKIKYGFPPQILQPPPSFMELKPLHLSHGDRVIVEKLVIQPEPKLPSLKVDTSHAIKNDTSNNLKSHPPAEWEKLLDTLSETDPWEMQSVISALCSQLSNQIIWNYAKKRPLLFRPGGIFYEQTIKDFGKRDDYHFCLKTFPNKIFVYNGKVDSVELCVKPHGHFMIREGMNTDIIKALNPNSVKPTCSLTLKNTATPDSESFSNSKVARTEMDPSLSTSKIARTEINPSLSTSKIARTEIDTSLSTLNANTTSKGSTNFVNHKLIRMGPGYSVLNSVESKPELINSIKTMADKLSKSMQMPNNQQATSIPERTDFQPTNNIDYSDSLRNLETFSAINRLNENKTFKDSSLSSSEIPSENNYTAKASSVVKKSDDSDKVPCDISKPLTNDIDHNKMDVDCI